MKSTAQEQTMKSMKANGGLISDLPDDIILTAAGVARGTLKIGSVVKVWQDDVSTLAKMIAKTEYAEQGLSNVARAKMVRYLLTKQGNKYLPF